MTRFATGVRVVLWGWCLIGAAQGQLVVTEIMSRSAHPGTDILGAGGLANGDWWELLNAGNAPVSLTGYRWDDDDRLLGNDFAIFPEFVLEPGQIVLIVEEDDVDQADGFRDAWGLTDAESILTRTMFSGGDAFSGLSSIGDELNLYNAAGNLVASRIFDEADDGFSFSWGADDTFFGVSKLGEHGAIQALSDGSGKILTNPNYLAPALDVASPGTVDGFVPIVIRGDLNDDKIVDLADMNLLCTQVSGDMDASFDLTEDGVLSAADVDAMLDIVNRMRGDVNFDGSINFPDFLVLSTNFGQSDRTWSHGDFDCTGDVRFPDFLSLSANFGITSQSELAVVPEPQGMVLWGLACAAMWMSIVARSGKELAWC